MKPFDLEAAKRGEPIITRDGRPVKFIAHVPEARAAHRVVIVDVAAGYIGIRHENGMWGESPRKDDLFMAPRKRTVWVNLYKGHNAVWHNSEESADVIAEDGISHRIGLRAYPIEIEE